MINNKKAITPITVIFFYCLGLFVWVFLLADVISYWGNYYVTIYTATGIEAWMYSNLNLIFFLVSLVALLVVMAVMSE
jgi:hypothetical protein